MNPPNLTRTFVWSSALMAGLCALTFALLYERNSQTALTIVVAVGGMWCSFALVTMLVQVFLYKPWDEREKQLAILKTQNDVFREMFAVTKKVGSAATQAASVERGMQASVETLKDELKLDGCSLRMMDVTNQQLLNVAGCGYRDPNFKPVPLSATQGIAGKALSERRPIFVEDTEREREFVKSNSNAAPIRSLFCVPLIEQGEVVGVLSGSCSLPRRFSEHEREILDLISSRLSALLQQYRVVKTA